MIVGIGGHIGIGKTYLAEHLYKITKNMGIPTKRNSFAKKVKEFAKDIFYVTKEGHYLERLMPYPDYRKDICDFLTQEKPHKIKTLLPHINNDDAIDFLQQIVERVSTNEIIELIKAWEEYYTPSFNEEHRKLIARKILQLIGRFGRKIHPDYWVDFVKRDIDTHTIVFVDDLRFVNEAEAIDFAIVLAPISIGVYFELMEERGVSVTVEMLKDISEKEWGIIGSMILEGDKKGMFIFIEDNNSLDEKALNIIHGNILLVYDKLRYGYVIGK